MKKIVVGVMILMGIMAGEARAITISASRNGENARLIMDGNPGTAWSAGAGASQWVEIDLEKLTTINKIRLLPAQSPAGRADQIISAGATKETMRPILTISPTMEDNQWLEVPLLPPKDNVRFIKITTTMSPSWISWREIEINEGSVSMADHLRYFSYYDTVADWNWSLANPLGTSFEEVMAMGNANLVELPLDPRGMTDPAAIERTERILETYHQRGVKARVAPGWIFFSSYASERGGTANLRPEWEERWLAYKDVLNKYQEDIYCFYFDEPIWNGITLDQFKLISQRVRSDFPKQALMVIEAWPVMRDQSIPAGYLQYVTDYGFDYYFSNEEPELSVGWNKYLNYYQYLKRVGGGKRLWVVADGFIGSNSNKEKLKKTFDLYVGLAAIDPQIKGIMNFLYSDKEFPTALRKAFMAGGAEYNPELLFEEIAVGSVIIKINGDVNGDKKVNLVDFSLWKQEYSKKVTTKKADFNNDGIVNLVDFSIWKRAYSEKI